MRILDFKTTWSEFQIPSQNTLAKAKPKYMFRVSSPPQSWSKAVVCVSTPRMYPQSGYFLVKSKWTLLNRNVFARVLEQRALIGAHLSSD